MAPTPTFSNRTSAATASSASQTITAPETSSLTPPIATLRLRGAHQPRRRIQWAEDVIDNEGMGKKSSKVCCIYHAPRAAGESSSSESDSSDSSSSSLSSESDYDGSETNENNDSRARMGGNKGKQKRALHHSARQTRLSDGKEHADNDHECNHHHDDQDPAGGAPHGRRKPKRSRKGQKRVNAYERIPKRSAGGGQTGTMTMVEKG